MRPNAEMSSCQATFDLKAARMMCREYDSRGECEIREKMIEMLPAALDEIERLQKVISEPIESFGAPELVAWAAKLQKIIAEYPEEERGNIPFVMTMGCHLEQFAKSWNSGVMKAQAKRIAELEAALHVEKSAHEETKYADSEAANQAFSRIAKQRAALKKLGQAKRERGKALVEERARVLYFCHAGDLMYDMDTLKESNRLKGKHIGEAREQLRQEGKL